MIEYFPIFVSQAFAQLSTTVQVLLNGDKPNAELNIEYTKMLGRLAAFDWIEKFKDVFLDDDLQSRIWLLKTQLTNGERFTPATLARELQGLLGQMTTSISKRKFAYIPPPNDKYFEQERLFGDKVYDGIEGARADIKEAGNCLAAGLYTACVFHLMRVSEYGLRALATAVNAQISDRGQPVPLEFGVWAKLIDAIDAKIEAARQLPSNAAKEQLLQMYSEANQHCSFVKDIWRNNVSHARTAYTETEAVGAFERIRDFMQFLADTTAKQW